MWRWAILMFALGVLIGNAYARSYAMERYIPIGQSPDSRE